MTLRFEGTADDSKEIVGHRGDYLSLSVKNMVTLFRPSALDL